MGLRTVYQSRYPKIDCHPLSSTVKDGSFADVGSITRIATFMDNVSEHVDITELEVKLKKIDQLQRKIEELKELLLD
ncbi:hypothetical protein TNCV_1667001 [Trichonephila clavipes]|nr:hypothetical protein TNCV_1667001 [Trichonephila clavipes]